MRAPRILVLAAALGLAAVACASAGPSSDPAEPIGATAARDGVSVALTADHARVAPGGDLAAAVLVVNIEPGPVMWQGGGCDLQGEVTVTPVEPLPVPMAGPVVGEGKAALRFLAIADAYTLRWPSPAEFAHVGVNWGCPANLAFHELKAGEEARADVVWVASTLAGSPAPAGEYVVEVTFPYMGRGLAKPPLDFEHERDVHEITARLVVEVEEGPPIPSPDDAMDAILETPAFAAALERHPRRTWESTTLRWSGGAWVLQVRYAPGGLLEGRLDPRSGSVVVRDGRE